MDWLFPMNIPPKINTAVNIFFFLNLNSFSSKIEYKTGKTINVNTVEVTKPPITTVANGFCTSAPAEVEIAIGKNPNAAAEAVSNTGRKRSRVPISILRFKFVIPSAFNSLKCSIKTIPFNTAIPKSAMNPTPAEILKGIPRSHKKKIPPTAENGIAV